MSLQQLQTERANFVAAYAAHKISKVQLDTALAANTAQQNALQAKQTQPTQAPAPVNLPTPGLANQLASVPQAPASTPNIGTTQALGSGALGSNANVFGNTGLEGVQPVINTQEKADIATIAVAGAIAPGLVATSVVAGEVANVGVQSAVKSIETGKATLVLPETPQEVLRVASDSALLGFVGGELAGGVVSGLGEAASPVVKAGVNVGVNAGLGGGVNAIASGGDLKSIAEGAAFGAGLGLAGEGIVAGAGKVAKIPAVNEAIQNVKDVTVGSKFTEITSVKEIEVQTTKGGETSVTRVTEPTIETVRLKGQDAKFFRENNLGTLDNPTIDLAGTQKVTKTVTDLEGIQEETTRFDLPAESSRSAEPILSAIKGEQLMAGKVKVGDLADFVKTPSDYSAVEKVSIESVPKKGTILEKTVASNSEAVLPDKVVSVRDFTGVELRGKVDPQVYGDAAKALPDPISQDIYKKLGGGVNQRSYFEDVASSKGSSKGGKGLGDLKEEVKLSQENLKRGSFGEPDTRTGVKEVLEGKVKTDISLGRAIVGEVQAGLGLKAPTVPVAVQKDNTQTTNRQGSGTMPNLGGVDVGQLGNGRTNMPTVPKENNPQKTTPIIQPIQLPKEQTATKTNMAKPIDITPISQPIGFEPPSTIEEPPTIIANPIAFEPVKETPVFTPTLPVTTKQPPIQIVDIPRKIGITQPPIDDIAPIVGPKQPQRDNPITSPITEPVTSPIIEPVTMPKQKNPQTVVPDIKIPNMPRARARSTLNFQLGGGKTRPGFTTPKYGKWYQKKHQIKTYSAMLQTVGVGGKPLKMGSNLKLGGVKGLSAKSFTVTPTFSSKKMLGGMGNFKASPFKLPKQPKRQRR